MCQGRREATGARGFGEGDHGWWVASGSIWKHGCVGTAFFHAAQPGKDGQAGDIRWRQPAGQPRRREVSGAQRLLPLWAEKVGLRPGRLEARRAWAGACAQKRGARPSSRNRTSDLRMSTAVCAVYSPPLYQLSYRRVHTGRAGSSGFVQMAEASSRGGPRPEGARSRLSVSLCLEVALPCPAPPCPAQTCSVLARRAQHTPSGVGADRVQRVCLACPGTRRDPAPRSPPRCPKQGAGLWRPRAPLPPPFCRAESGSVARRRRGRSGRTRRPGGDWHTGRLRRAGGAESKRSRWGSGRRLPTKPAARAAR